MRILLATVFNYPHTGGLSTHMTTLKSGLEALGHDVEILSFSDLPYYKQQFFAKGPSFFMNRMVPGKGILLGHKLRQNMLKDMIKKQHDQKPYDLVNAQDIYATFASLEAGVNTVTTVHGYMTFEAISRGSIKSDSEEAKVLQEKETEAYKKTRQVITVDYRIRNYVRDLAGVDGIRVHNFIDVDQFRPQTDRKQEFRKKFGFKEEDKLIFIPRRLTKKNGVIYPTKALSLIQQSFPEAKLIYAGSGEEEQAVRDEAKANGTESSVHFLGDIPHEVMKDYYAMSDITMVPSVHSEGVEEATSISALEAMGSGVPVIASAVGGLKEIVDHEENGLLVPEKDITALAQAVERILSTPTFGERMALQARLLIEQEYSHVSAATSYASIYENVLQHVY
ncbi:MULTISPECIES: glycosyltransferase family 4 protein [Pontibacillus]|uniref:Glycosyltransferase family 4 protein n=1 Tax=Pontibacillus chungwhensis TaxID=265426 RepID=A0ABY8UYK6_9BACI|nr:MULTISPECIES: glycosyltransferase family 4 protein [Pontibacillus]MCD5324097.1 glycosyltransferase family 4 protein [Pontibacillus sp. HN14]WIF97846.1 glycosyltransferase family 4 protein [Pontibacillus chungwhensis]